MPPPTHRRPVTSRARGMSSTPPTWCSAGWPVQTANLLRGKNKPTTPPTSTVVTHHHHQRRQGRPDQRQGRHQEELPAPGHPGGLTVRTTAELLASHPERVVEKPSRACIPKNKLSDAIASKLKVYAGPEPSPRGPAPRALRDQAGGPVSNETNDAVENIEDVVEQAEDGYDAGGRR